MQSATIEDLKKVIALSELPDEHLQWILDHSEYNVYEDGEVIIKTGEVPEYMMFIIEGVLSFYMNKSGTLVHYFNFTNDDATGGATGLLPYSRMKTSPGSSFAVGRLRSIRMHKDHFSGLERLNPDLIQRLIGYMTERARTFATTQLQHEKVNALGNLAAGIAHEMNNPAAAIRNISDELAKRLNRNYELTKKLLECSMTPEHLQSIRNLVEKKEGSLGESAKRSTLQRMQDEDEIEEWLEKKGVNARETAETFSEYGFSIKELEEIHSNLGAGAFARVIPWLENLISSEKLIKDLADASSRISNLVTSIKSHVHMDRTNELQPTNIHQDIENTLTLLGFKFREKNIEVIKNFCKDMPEVPVYIGELNQVWTNLIDNAIFAMKKNGVLTIETKCDDKNVTVSVIDNGVGIPKEIMSRIFEPFFTTKKVGEGTGIGLDIINRIVKRHNGEIKVNSAPGRTEFSVCIPLVQKQQQLQLQ